MTQVSLNPIATQLSTVLEHPWFATAEQAQKFASGTAKVVRSVVTWVENKLPAKVVKYAPATKILAVFNLVLVTPKFVKQALEGFSETIPSAFVDKAWRATITLGTALDGFADTITALKKLGRIDSERLAWTENVAAFTGPLQGIDLYLTTVDFARCKEFYNEFKGRIRPISSADATSRQQIYRLSNACREVIRQKDRINKICKIDSKANIDVIARSIIQETKTNPEEALRRGQTFLATLNIRVRAAYGFDLAGVVVSIAKVVITIVTTSVSKNPYCLGIAVAVYSISFLHFSLSSAVLNSDPFALPRDVWHQKVVYQIRVTFNQLFFRQP